MKNLAPFVFLLAMGTGTASAEVVLPWYVLAGGGGVAAGTTYELQASLAQPCTGEPGGAAWTLEAGFWTGVRALTVAVPGTPPRPPANFALLRAYPNPAHVGGAVGFEVPALSRVTLRIFNVAGQVVATVADAEYEPGLHRAHMATAALPAGIYFVQMRAGAFQSNQKLVVLH